MAKGDMSFGIPVYDEDGKFMYFHMPPGTEPDDEQQFLSAEEAGDFELAPVSIPIRNTVMTPKDRSLPVDVTPFTREQMPTVRITEDVALPPKPPPTGPATSEELKAIAADPELLRQTKMYPDEPGKGRAVALANLRARTAAPAEGGVAFGDAAPGGDGSVPAGATASPDLVLGQGIDELDRLIGRGAGGRTVNQTTKTTTVQRQQQLETPESQAAAADAELAREELKDRIANQGQIAQDKGESVALGLNALASRLDDQNIQDKQRRAEYENRLRGLFQQQEQALADFQKQAASFDANRLMGRGSANSVVFAIAAGLGAVSATKTGINHALGVINKAIDRDIHEQETKLRAGTVAMEASGQMFDRMRQLYGDSEAAAAATRAGLYDAAKLRVQAMQEQYGGEQSMAAAETMMAELDLKAAEAREQAAKAAAGVVMEQSVTKPVRVGGSDPLKRFERLVKVQGNLVDIEMKKAELASGKGAATFSDGAKNRIAKVVMQRTEAAKALANIRKMIELRKQGTGLVGGGASEWITSAGLGAPLARAGLAAASPFPAANRTQQFNALGDATAISMAAAEQGKSVNAAEAQAYKSFLGVGVFMSDDDALKQLENAEDRINRTLQGAEASLVDDAERQAADAAMKASRGMDRLMDGSDKRLTPVSPR